MSRGRAVGARRAWAILAAILFGLGASAAWGQTGEEIERPGPPERVDFEPEAGRPGALPEGWYNQRDVELVAEGGVVGPHFLRFRNDRPGRPARASRAFGADGRETGALGVGVWVRVEDVVPGERVGEEPALMITLLDEQLRPLSRWSLGSWSERTVGQGWVRVAGRMPVPPGARDAILTVGLYGATGTLDIDGLTFASEPAGGRETTDLIRNGGFEWGDPAPTGWELDGGVRRVFPGRGSDAALELDRAGARARAGIALPVGRFPALEVQLSATAASLRGSGGASADLYFLDDAGVFLPGTTGAVRLFRWAGSFNWRPFRMLAAVPAEARWAVLQLSKSDSNGRLRIDDVQVRAAPEPRLGAWTPYHVADDTAGWHAYEPTGPIEPGSALDFSFLLGPPADSGDRVEVRDGHLHHAEGPRARFFGVALLPPLAFAEPEQAEALSDRLARSGVNLVRLGGLDTPYGPGQGLFNDARDDTREFDPLALPRLDHLIAALKERGLHLALELQSGRRFRAGDDVPGGRALPPGGGPAAAFDPTIQERALDTARALLSRVNRETGLPLLEDPALAWVTLAGERSLFDLIDDPDALPAELAEALRERMSRGSQGSGRRFWRAAEAEQWETEAKALRAAGLKAPIAGSSHWRREPEFVAVQAAPGLDLIDDRLYWWPPRWSPPDRRSLLWDTAGGLRAQAAQKRRADRPYVVGEWGLHTFGAWALPFEAADLIAATAQAAGADWDALVRRGVAPYPEVWGAAVTGTGGDNDLFVVPGAINGNPPVFALLPHAASLFLRREDGPPRVVESPGRVAVESPHTQALAGWTASRPLESRALTIESFGRFAVVAVSSVGAEPIGRADRLLITAVARASPTGLTWADEWRREVAEAGRPPVLVEPLRARVTWRREGTEAGAPAVRAYALDHSGRRTGEVAVETRAEGVRLDLNAGRTLHWELVAGED